MRCRSYQNQHASVWISITMPAVGLRPNIFLLDILLLSGIVVPSLIVPPPYFLTKKYIMIYSKLIFFLFKTTKFHQWDTEHVAPQSYLLFSCGIYLILSKYNLKFSILAFLIMAPPLQLVLPPPPRGNNSRKYGKFLLTTLGDGSTCRQITILAVHVVCSGTRIITKPDSEVLDLFWFLLENLQNVSFQIYISYI